MAVLGYLPNLKRGLGIAFGAHFLHDFSIKMFLIKSSINEQSFNVISFFLLKISNKMCCSYLDTVDDVINFKIYLWSTSKSNGWQGEKEGKMEIQKYEILKSEKSFLDEIKNFLYFLKCYHLVRNKILVKNSGHKL